MGRTYDVYLMGPAPGVSAEELAKGLPKLFGELPAALVRRIGQGPVKIKAGVDLELAQRFVESVKAVGGLIELRSAGSPPPRKRRLTGPVAVGFDPPTGPQQRPAVALDPPVDPTGEIALPPPMARPVAGVPVPPIPVPPAAPAPDAGRSVPPSPPAPQRRSPDKPTPRPQAPPPPRGRRVFAPTGPQPRAERQAPRATGPQVPVKAPHATGPQAPVKAPHATGPQVPLRPTGPQVPVKRPLGAATPKVPRSAARPHHGTGPQQPVPSRRAPTGPQPRGGHWLDKQDKPPAEEKPGFDRDDFEAAFDDHGWGPGDSSPGLARPAPGPGDSSPGHSEDGWGPGDSAPGLAQPIPLDDGGLSPITDLLLGGAPEEEAPTRRFTRDDVEDEEPPRSSPVKGLVVPRPPPADDPLRVTAHCLTLEPLYHLKEVAARLPPELALGVLGAADLDPIVVNYLQQQLQLAEPLQLYFSEELGAEKEASGVAGVAITTRVVAWADGHVPLREILGTAIVGDAAGRPLVEIRTAEQTHLLRRLSELATLVLGETVARLARGHALWLSPATVLPLRRRVSALWRDLSRAAVAGGEGADHARTAVDCVRHYLDLVLERYEHWERSTGLGREQPGDAEIFDLVTAPEFIEIRGRAEPLLKETVATLLVALRPLLHAEEGVLALFELRDPAWRPPAGATPGEAGMLYVSRQNLPGAPGTDPQALVGASGALTSKRLLFFRIGAPRAALAVELEQVEEVRALEGEAPQLLLRHRGGGKPEELRHVCSGNLLAPLPGDPLRHIRRLAARIVEAKERQADAQQRAAAEHERLPRCPEWLERELADVPLTRPARMGAATIALMRAKETPRAVRRLARVGSRIELIKLKGLRQRLAAAAVDLSDLGERVLLLPGDLFESPADGLLATENALLVSGAGSGRVAWGRLTRVETVEERRLFVTLIGSEAEVLAIRTRDGATAAFVPTLITTLAHAANID